MLTRRAMLQCIVSAAALTLAPVAAAATPYDVSYYAWTRDIAEALDHLDVVKRALGASPPGRVEVVKQGGAYGVVLRMGVGLAQAQALARAHSQALRELEDTDEELANELPRGDYARVYNVSYGLGPNLAVLVDHFQKVSGLLGAGVTRSLVIERTDHGNYALVYKRFGELEGTRKAAARHDRLLRGKGIRAAIIQEQSFTIVYDGTSVFTEEEVLEAEPEGQFVEVSVEAPEPPVEEPVVEVALASEPQAPPEAAALEPHALLVEDPELTGSAEDFVDDAWGPLPEEEGASGDALADASAVVPAIGGVAAEVVELVEGTSTLSATINGYVQSLRKAGTLASDERSAWLVYDLKADRVVSAINADLPLQCASMVKPFVMLAFMHEVQRGRFTYGPTSRSKLQQSIQRSSNSATNWVMGQVGGPAAVQRILKSHYGHICQNVSIVEKIPAGGRTYRNRASANDYARYLKAVWAGQLPRSVEQRRLLNLPGRDRLYNGAPSIPPGTAVYNKTGSTSMLCGDMGILVAQTAGGGKVPYIVVGIIEKKVRASSYSSWISARSNVIRGVSDRAYLYMKGVYNLK